MCVWNRLIDFFHSFQFFFRICPISSLMIDPEIFFPFNFQNFARLFKIFQFYFIIIIDFTFVSNFTFQKYRRIKLKTRRMRQKNWIKLFPSRKKWILVFAKKILFDQDQWVIVMAKFFLQMDQQKKIEFFGFLFTFECHNCLSSSSS